jgi:hypothetical protein
MDRFSSEMIGFQTNQRRAIMRPFILSIAACLAFVATSDALFVSRSTVISRQTVISRPASTTVINRQTVIGINRPLVSRQVSVVHNVGVGYGVGAAFGRPVSYSYNYGLGVSGAYGVGTNFAAYSRPVGVAAAYCPPVQQPVQQLEQLPAPQTYPVLQAPVQMPVQAPLQAPVQYVQAPPVQYVQAPVYLQAAPVYLAAPAPVYLPAPVQYLGATPCPVGAVYGGYGVGAIRGNYLGSGFGYVGAGFGTRAVFHQRSSVIYLH